MSKSLTIAAWFFDLDGTLIDTAPDFVSAVNQVAVQNKLPLIAPAKIRSYVSEGTRGLVQHCLLKTQNDAEHFEALRQQILDAYELVDHQNAQLFPGARAIIDEFEARKLPWGIVTNKPERFAVPLIHRLQLDQRSACLICPEHVEFRKPHPESLLLAARGVGIEPGHCMYVGDHLRDIQAGQAAGMQTSSVGFGYFPASEDPLTWQADYHFEDLAALASTFGLTSNSKQDS